MEIPKKIQKLLYRRAILAQDLIDACCKLDTWLEKNGADLTDPDITDSTMTGCMIYCEPGTAKSCVENYIKNRM